MGLTETWLKDMENIDIYNIPDYILLSNPREKRGGGVGMNVSNRLRFKKRNDLSINSDNFFSFESIFIEIENNNVFKYLASFMILMMIYIYIYIHFYIFSLLI